MSKPRQTNTNRIEHLEGCYADLDNRLDDLTEKVLAGFKAAADEQEKTRGWMANGFSEKVAGIITVKLAEYQAAQWEREREERRLQLEEQKEANRAYGEKRDAERAIQQAAADRKSRMHIALVAPLASIATAVIMWLLTRL